MQLLSRRTRHLLLQKFHGASSITKGRRNSQSQTASIAYAPFLMHQALPINARSARQSTIRCFICPPPAADPLTNNTDKEIVTSLSSFLANYLSESSNSEEAMLLTVVVLICDSDGSRRACRALLDCGSQANFVTKKFVEALGWKRVHQMSRSAASTAR